MKTGRTKNLTCGCTVRYPQNVPSPRPCDQVWCTYHDQPATVRRIRPLHRAQVNPDAPIPYVLNPSRHP